MAKKKPSIVRALSEARRERKKKLVIDPKIMCKIAVWMLVVCFGIIHVSQKKFSDEIQSRRDFRLDVMATKAFLNPGHVHSISNSSSI